ncbi:MAG TPA: flagellar biosynthetic protein FliR [Chromobacteriaceae bacterium]|nr:flagellar biosynthetic protein FliR [Chromobacteriaceae bacterium]
MEELIKALPELLSTIWWPFCRFMAALSLAPFLGENSVPVRARLMIAVALAVIVIPVARPLTAVDPVSLHGIVVAIEQAMIGLLFGLAFHLVNAAIMMFAFLVSSQMGLSMAVMNDPINGASSDVISSLLFVLTALVFFSIDGHLIVTNEVFHSFKAWPVGQGLDMLSFKTLVYSTSWMFSAALLLSLPIVFSTMVVQIGFGFLNRAAATLNLFSLGFSVITLFGLVMLSYLIRSVPEHYLHMTDQVLTMLHQQMGGGRG